MKPIKPYLAITLLLLEFGFADNQLTSSDVVLDGSSQLIAIDLAETSGGRAPVSGVLKTIYGDDAVVADFGDGTCTNRTIAIAFNGGTTSKTIGGRSRNKS